MDRKSIWEENNLFEQIVSIIKKIYIYFIRLQNKINTKKHNKIVFLLSFPSTSCYVLDSLYNEFKNDLIICYTSNGRNLAEYYQKKGCTIYSLNFFSLLVNRVVSITKSSSIVLCDNYFAFLGAVEFDSETEVVQLWHANGAIKSFGLSASYAKKSNKKNQERYLNVYRKFTRYIISSENMKKIFEKNYRQNISILPFGYPPTDIYFDKKWLSESEKKFNEIFSPHKKILLYAPTYRERNSNNPIIFSELKKQLGEDWEIVVKLHPHDEMLGDYLAKEKSITTDLKGMSVQELLPFVDCLVTDYSSLPFEYSLAKSNAKMVFFCYDFDQYNLDVGIEPEFKNWMPGEIVYTQSEMVDAIFNDNHMNDGVAFNKEWNGYVDGESRRKLVEWVKLKNGNRENNRYSD